MGLECEELMSLVRECTQCVVTKPNRSVEILELLLNQPITLKVFQEANAKEKVGKKIKKLTKVSDTKVATAANKVIKVLYARFSQKLAAQHDQNEQPQGEVVKPEVQVAIHKQKLEESKKAPDTAQPNSIKSTGNQLRDKVQKALHEAFLIACEENGTDKGVAEQKAVELEDALHQKFNVEAFGGEVSKEYKIKFRCMSFNLKDKHNPDLRSRILLGEIKTSDVILWTPQQLASDKRKEEVNEIKKENLLNAQAAAPTVSSTDQFKCGKCKQRKCTYYQMQTRSADEPMTTFVTCTNCNNRWKFS